jgi:UDP-N-acetyl-2-amino-2-deoxyglucuronate dehydrogenase
MKFAILGAAGFVAKRHLKAIQETGNEIIAAVDPYDAVGFLDGYSLNIEYFKETETFIAFAKQSDIDLDYISVCTPNHLHFEHCKIAMSLNANVICEKPLVIDPSDIDRLLDYEAKTGKTVNTVLQLRLHPKLIEKKRMLY